MTARVVVPSVFNPILTLEEPEFFRLETLSVLIAVIVSRLKLKENFGDFAQQNHTMDQDCPAGIVTVMPALIVIGPADIAFFARGTEGRV
jgi:hypothetical protein